MNFICVSFFIRDVDLCWTIVAEDPFDHVTISFSQFQLANNGKCGDYLVVYDGSTPSHRR